MEYAIKEIARVIGAKTNQLLDDTVSLLLTDSRRLSFPEKSLFFALKTKTNDGHRYIQELYKLRVRNFVVSDMLPEFESMKDANFLIVKDTLRALQKLATHHRKQFNIPVIGITGSNGKTIVRNSSINCCITSSTSYVRLGATTPSWGFLSRYGR